MTLARPFIAVVDDEESVRKALKRLIHSAGLEVETFSSGSDFLQSIETREPDCVVLDLHMPHVNGFEVQARLAHSAHRVPVVVITGHDMPEARERVMAAGAAGYLRKPVDDQALLDTIASAIVDATRATKERPPA